MLPYRPFAEPWEMPGTGLTGLEPATSGVTDRHSNQLSYSPNSLLLCKQLPAPRESRGTGDVLGGPRPALDGAYWTRTSDLYDVNVAL